MGISKSNFTSNFHGSLPPVNESKTTPVQGKVSAAKSTNTQLRSTVVNTPPQPSKPEIIEDMPKFFNKFMN